MRWPWESSKDYKARLDARTARIEARQEGRSSRVESRESARAAGGYYSAEAIAARQGTVTSAIGSGLTAAEGVAQAFGYDVDLDGDDGAPRTSSTLPTTTSSTASTGMDQQTMLILAALALGGVFLLSSRK